MRNINRIVVHCTAGSSTAKTTDIIKYWRDQLGWRVGGYHYIVSANGLVENITPEDKIANGVAGYNANSIHVCYKGGWNGKDTRTDMQKSALRALIKSIKKRHPDANIMGHRDLSPDKNKDGKITPNEFVKLCPCFDAMPEYADLL